MIDPPGYVKQIRFQLEVHPAVAELGARQCGKTTLAEMYGYRHASQPVTRFDLENRVPFQEQSEQIHPLRWF